MFCQKCGAELKESARFCNKCGAPVNGTGTMNHASNAAPAVQSYQNLGGALMVIVVLGYVAAGAMFYNVLRTSINTLIRLSRGVIDLSLLSLFVCLGTIAIYVMGGIMFIRFANRIRHRNHEFLRLIQSWSIGLMIAYSVYNTVVILLERGYALTQTEEFAVVFANSIINDYFRDWMVGLAAGIGALVGLSIYFGKSERARIYMGSDEYLRRSLFNKKNASPMPAGSNPSAVSPYPQYNGGMQPDYQGYPQSRTEQVSESTAGIWKPLMIISLIAGFFLILFAVALILLEAEIGLIAIIGTVAVGVAVFGVVCAVKYVRSMQ